MPTSARWEVTNSPKILVKTAAFCGRTESSAPTNEWESAPALAGPPPLLGEAFFAHMGKITKNRPGKIYVKSVKSLESHWILAGGAVILYIQNDATAAPLTGSRFRICITLQKEASNRGVLRAGASAHNTNIQILTRNQEEM